MNDHALTGASSVADALENARKLLATHPASAAEQAREVIRTESGISEAHVLLSCALRALGQAPAAAGAEQRALEIANADPIIIRAREQIEAKELRNAEELLQLYLADTPNDPVAICLRADIQMRLGHFGEARRLLERALSLAPSFEEARQALADLPSAAGDGSQVTRTGQSADDEEWFTGPPAGSGREPGHE